MLLSTRLGDGVRQGSCARVGVPGSEERGVLRSFGVLGGEGLVEGQSAVGRSSPEAHLTKRRMVLLYVPLWGEGCLHTLHPSSSFLLLECSFSSSPLGIYLVAGWLDLREAN